MFIGGCPLPTQPPTPIPHVAGLGHHLCDEPHTRLALVGGGRFQQVIVPAQRGSTGGGLAWWVLGRGWPGKLRKERTGGAGGRPTHCLACATAPQMCHKHSEKANPCRIRTPICTPSQLDVWHLRPATRLRAPDCEPSACRPARSWPAACSHQVVELAIHICVEEIVVLSHLDGSGRVHLSRRAGGARGTCASWGSWQVGSECCMEPAAARQDGQYSTNLATHAACPRSGAQRLAHFCLTTTRLLPFLAVCVTLASGLPKLTSPWKVMKPPSYTYAPVPGLLGFGPYAPVRPAR